MCKIYLLQIASFFLLSFTANFIEGEQCDLFTPFDFRNTTPVILIKKPQDRGFHLFKPTGTQTRFPVGTTFGLACTGRNNYFDIPDKVNPNQSKKTWTYGEIQCSGDANIAGPFSKIQCRSIPSSTIRRTQQNCGVKGLIHEVGFTINNVFYGPILTICYDHMNRIIIYTTNTINGAAIAEHVVAHRRPDFNGNLTGLSTTKYNNIYKRSNQLKRFSEVLSAKQEFIGTGNRFLDRGHLTPHADYVMVYEQYATYYFMNTVPQFKDINNGNWVRIEKLTRDYATQLKDDLIVYTSYSISKPATFTAAHKSVLLDAANKNIIIPDKVYKILYYPKTKSGIVFVVNNNPYEKKMNPPPPPSCQNVCAKANLKDVEELHDASRGFVMCCELKYIKENVVDVYREMVSAGHNFQRILVMPTQNRQIS